MHEGQIIPLTVVGLLFGIPIVTVIAHYANQSWKAWLELNLKREMVARGYTAEEIVHVLRSKSSSRTRWSHENAEQPPTDVVP